MEEDFKLGYKGQEYSLSLIQKSLRVTGLDYLSVRKDYLEYLNLIRKSTISQLLVHSVAPSIGVTVHSASLFARWWKSFVVKVELKGYFLLE